MAPRPSPQQYQLTTIVCGSSSSTGTKVTYYDNSTCSLVQYILPSVHPSVSIHPSIHSFFLSLFLSSNCDVVNKSKALTYAAATRPLHVCMSVSTDAVTNSRRPRYGSGTFILTHDPSPTPSQETLGEKLYPGPRSQLPPSLDGLEFIPSRLPSSEAYQSTSSFPTRNTIIRQLRGRRLIF